MSMPTGVVMFWGLIVVRKQDGEEYTTAIPTTREYLPNLTSSSHLLCCGYALWFR